MLKPIFVFLVIAAASVAGNPAPGAKEWRWKARRPTVSPNIKGLPFKKVIDSYTPTVRIPGTKTVEGCGPVKPPGRIVGGSEAIPHSYPWQVALFVDDKWFCGGSIINEEWVLTAAHCAYDAEVIEVVAGAHNIRESEDTQRSIISDELVIHHDWNPFLVTNDVALIKLPEPLTWSDAIAPVCLPSRRARKLPPGTLVNPSGWGLPSDSADGISDVLRQVTVPVGVFDKCNEIYGGHFRRDLVICTDSTGGKGTCNGDSGGPMNYIDGGVTYTRGIVSFGSAAGCEAGDPDGFTRVIGYLDWIETMTGIAIDD